MFVSLDWIEHVSLDWVEPLSLGWVGPRDKDKPGEKESWDETESWEGSFVDADNCEGSLCETDKSMTGSEGTVGGWSDSGLEGVVCSI